MRTPQFTTLKALFAGVRSARTAQATAAAPRGGRRLCHGAARHVVSTHSQFWSVG